MFVTLLGREDLKGSFSLKTKSPPAAAARIKIRKKARYLNLLFVVPRESSSSSIFLSFSVFSIGGDFLAATLRLGRMTFLGFGGID